MKALSVKQPWTYLICAGFKDIENRTWKLPEKYKGQRVLIQASAKPIDAFQKGRFPLTPDQERYCLENEKEKEDPWAPFRWGVNAHLAKVMETQLSMIVGSVIIADCVQNYPSIWAEKGVYNWVLKDPILFENPILNIKGSLSFWNYEGELPDKY